MSSKLLPLGRYVFKHFAEVSRSLSTVRALSYKSSISLDKLYPESSLKLTTPSFQPENPKERFNGYIPIEKLEVTYSNASGPGGQNVNNVKTKVDLRVKIYEADWIDVSLREKIIKENYNKISKDGYLIFKSDLTRSQHLNLADCMKKLRDLIRKADEPVPAMSAETYHIIRKRQEKENRRRLQMKRHASMIRRMSQPYDL